MSTIYKHECKAYIKTLIIWTLCVAGMGFACILLYQSMETDIASMAEGFSNMGAFADAFGMSQLSIATLAGFYATEIGTVHGLGSAMFAAIISSVILSKEEDGHTGEFLYTFPVRRGKVVLAKWLAVVTHIVVFTVLCVGIYLIGFVCVDGEIELERFFLFHFMQLFMNLQIAAICFCMSAFVKKNKLGLGLGIVMLLYAYDMMARVIPDLKDSKVITPYSYANASDLFSTGEIEKSALLIGMVVLCIALITAYQVYRKRDLAS